MQTSEKKPKHELGQDKRKSYNVIPIFQLKSNPFVPSLTSYHYIVYYNPGNSSTDLTMSFSILERGNDALKINRPDANRHLTTNGSNWLWAVTAVFALALLGWLAWTLMRYKAKTGAHNSKHGDNIDPQSGVQRTAVAVTRLYRERIFHYIWSLAAFIGFISYFTMAANLGNTPVRQYSHKDGNESQTRSIFYVRYIYWFLAWPLIVTANLLVSGVSWATIFFAVSLQEIWVVSWLCGALVESSYKWGYFVFGLFAYFVLAYVMMVWGREHATRINTGKDYTMLAGILVLAWMAFPIAWGLSEGSNKLSVTGEMIFYGILDLIAVPIYGTLFLIYSKPFAPNLFHFTQVGRVSGVEHYDGLTHQSGAHHSDGVV
jgi:bacteriorhodopsin